LEDISFNKPSVSELMNLPITQLKSTSAGDDATFTLSMVSSAYYSVNTGNGQTTLDGSVYTDTATDVTTVYLEAENSPDPIEHVIDTTTVAAFNTHSYTSTGMIWTQTNNKFSMGISRNALAAETD